MYQRNHRIIWKLVYKNVKKNNLQRRKDNNAIETFFSSLKRYIEHKQLTLTELLAKVEEVSIRLDNRIVRSVELDETIINQNDIKYKYISQRTKNILQDLFERKTNSNYSEKCVQCNNRRHSKRKKLPILAFTCFIDV